MTMQAGGAVSQKYVMAVDSGTTSVRSIVFDHDGRVVSCAQQPLTQYYPQPGWVEHDADEILVKQVATMGQALEKAGVHSDAIAAVGITNQRETCVVWNRHTGKPVHNAICWQCRRTAPMVERLVAQGRADAIRSKTGLVADPYFSGTKVAWILDHVEGARQAAEVGDLLFGTVDSWLVWNLTEGAVHATDRTNASRTMLYDIHTLAWDEDLLDTLGVPAAMLPEVLPSRADYGRVSAEVMGARPPILGVAGDQQASLFGHCCFEPGAVKATYGTGCFILMHTGADAVASGNGLITTIAATPDDGVAYALEGSVFNAGTVVQWLRDELGIIDDAAQTEQLAESVPDAGGVCFVPAFTGLGAPWWDADARGMICGLTRGSGRAHIVRAALESEAYQVADVLGAMREDSGRELAGVAVDGGGSMNGFTMRLQADLLGCSVVRPRNVETTALGAAYLAGLGAGYWGGLDDLRANACEAVRFEPSMDGAARRLALDAWHAALDRCRVR